MSYKEDIEALKIVKSEIEKAKEKTEKKAVKEREKVSDIFVTVCGEKCYTEDEINEMYTCDYITCAQSDRYIEKLLKKKEAAGEKESLTKSERACKIFGNMLENLACEISDLERKQEEFEM